MKELSHINQERIIDSLQVRLSDEEQREFDLWPDDSENNKSEYETLKKIWKYTPFYMAYVVALGILWGIMQSVNMLYIKSLLDEL